MIRLLNKIRFYSYTSKHAIININAILKRNIYDLPHMVQFHQTKAEKAKEAKSKVNKGKGKNLKIPFLADDEKQEIYMKYMEDQELYSFRNLSQEYGTSLERTKAIVLLMKQRNDLISRDQLILLKYDNPDYNEKPVVSAEPFLDVPEKFMNLYSIYIEDITISIENLLKIYNENCETEEAHIKLEEAQVKEILEIIEDHQHRFETLEAYEEVMEDKIERAVEKGADLSIFRETRSAYQRSKSANYVTKSNKHVPRSFQALYYPSFLRDESIEAAEARLLRRVAQETEAQLQHNIEYYEEAYNPKEQQVSTNINDDDDNNKEDLKNDSNNINIQKDSRFLQYHHVKLQTTDKESFSRWKIGFVDTSINRLNARKLKKEHPDAVAIPPRTVIRTRNGR